MKAIAPLRRRRLSACVAAAAALAIVCTSKASDAGEILETGKKLYSQNDEELIVRDFFQDRRGGVFLEVGCAWPERKIMKHDQVSWDFKPRKEPEAASGP